MSLRNWAKDLLERRHLGIGARLALMPLELLGNSYGVVMKARRGLYRSGVLSSTHPGVPVICVGNITLGGTGKTPIVEKVVEILKECGVRPVVLSRGYGGKSKARASVVFDGKELKLSPEEAGDEPVLHARRLGDTPVVIGAKRVYSAKFALNSLDVDAIVMDDGFQHLKIARDLNIVAVDARHPFGNGHCLPRGNLREPSSALKDAQVVILTRSAGEEGIEKTKSKLLEVNRDLLILRADHQPQNLWVWPGGETMGLRTLSSRKVVVFAGIGQPVAFLNQVKRLGANVMEFVPYPDHHEFTAQDMAQLENWAKITNAEAIVTTEKDAVKLWKYKLDTPLWVLSTKMDMSEEDTAKLRGIILKFCKKRIGDV